jgi:raffinose/stachyose/melibiose transport system permease protein
VTHRRPTLAVYLVLVPALAVFFLVQTLPALQGVFYSFTNSKGYGTWDFIGLDNYAKLFTDPRVRSSYVFTGGFAIVAALLTNVVSLAVAVALNGSIRFRNIARAVFFIPYVLPTIVIGFIFSFFFTSVLPDLGRALGIDGLQQSLLGNPSTAWIGVTIVAVWRSAAFATIIYIAGLQTVPEELTEAAVLDGAGGWRRFWSITFPLLAPFFTINVVLSLKDQLMVFDLIVALTKGGPGGATNAVSYFIYTDGFGSGQFAYQSANAVLYFILMVVITVVQLVFLRRREVTL